jgi:hypothetical protein
MHLRTMDNIINAQNNMSVEQIVLLITSQNSKLSHNHHKTWWSQWNKQTNKQNLFNQGFNEAKTYCYHSMLSK